MKNKINILLQEHMRVLSGVIEDMKVRKAPTEVVEEAEEKFADLVEMLAYVNELPNDEVEEEVRDPRIDPIVEQLIEMGTKFFTKENGKVAFKLKDAEETAHSILDIIDSDQEVVEEECDCAFCIL